MRHYGGVPSEGHRGGAMEQLLSQVLEHPRAQQLLEDVLQRAETAVRDRFAGKVAECPPRPSAADDGARAGRRRRASPPPPAAMDATAARVILGFSPTRALTERAIKERKRALALVYHPDHDGSDESMQRLNAAADVLLAELR